MAASGVKPDLSLSHYSFSSFNSQEQLESVLKDLVRGRNGIRGWCDGEPVTDSGKRRQIFKMLLLILSPLFLMVCINVYFIQDTIEDLKETFVTRSIMRQSTELGRLIHVLQRERDQSVLYISQIGPETKTYLLKRYLETDDVLDAMSFWPTSRLDQYSTKRTFQRHVEQHRNELSLLQWTVFEEMSFYSDILNLLIVWLYGALTETRFSVLWKTIVAYQKIVSSKEDLGVERALGAYFYSHGGFKEMDNYILYNTKVNVFRHVFGSAQNYSPLVQPMSNYENAHSVNLSSTISMLRDEIQNRNISVPSLSKATHWFDNMTIYMDILFDIQLMLAEKITDQLNSKEKNIVKKIIVGSTLLAGVFISLPILIRTIYQLTSNIQSYAITLADKTRELNREKKRTESLLYQMLPKPVAEQLKRQKDVNAEYFKEVTVFFSDISGFTQITVQLQPMQVIRFLNELFRLFDERIELYDVYKVETIGDSYMVASGLPRRNKSRHASEIANMSLDLIASCSDLELTDLGNDKVRLRIGVHSGPVVAGVVGSKMPRYCLFGDTVNTAARLETNGEPNRIHVSQATQKILSKHGDYELQKRGLVQLKGKGQLVTYWLLGRGQGMEATREPPSPTTSRRSTLQDLHDCDFMRPRVPAKREVAMAGQSFNKGIEMTDMPVQDLEVDDLGPLQLPSYDEIEREFRDRPSPPILQLTEGYHF